jgi:hypothetical protein
MKSRKKILAGMVAMALGSGAYAATFEGRLACDKDPREAGTSCMLYVPVTDTVGLPVYTQQISVTYLLEPRAAAAAGMDSEAQASSEISASAPLMESLSSELPKQTSLSDDPAAVYPRSEVAEGTPIPSERDASASPERSGGFFSWFKGSRTAEPVRDLASTSLMESDHLAGTEPGSEQGRVASSSGRGIFSWLTGERASRTMSERPAAIEAQPGSSAVSESSSASSSEIVASTSEARSSSRGGLFGWLTAGSADERSRDLASTTLMESDHLAGTEPGEHQQTASAPSQPGFFSRLFGDRGSRSTSEQSAAIESQQSSDQLVITESSAAGSPRDLASTSLMESDHLAGTEPSAEPQS